MGDEQLLHDWEFRMREAPDSPDGSGCGCGSGSGSGSGSGWAYNWDYAECSTSQPTDRSDQGHCYATMFLICNHTEDPVFDFIEFCGQLSRHGALKAVEKQILVIVDNDGPAAELDDDGKKTVSVTSKQSGAVLLRGWVTLGKSPDPNVGGYAELQAITEKGMFLMRVMEASTPPGYCSIIDHDRVEFDLGDGRILVKVSGFSPDDTSTDADADADTDTSTTASSNNELATRFTVRENGTDVARCHLSYRDGSNDPSMGPTIEMMAVHQDYRDKNILPVLWYWVRCFIEENCTLECMNNDTTPGNVMVKATRLVNAEIERKYGVPITDKDFFYDCAGFSVREQKGYMAAFMGSTRPKDEEAVIFIPLLSKDQIRERTEYKGFNNIDWPSTKGARCCYHCDKVWIGHLRCANCKVASYCTKSCQKQDWRRHKKWCGKTKEQVHEFLVEQGLRVQQPDGTYTTVRGSRGMPAGMR
jgi:hypothetical protein